MPAALPARSLPLRIGRRQREAFLAWARIVALGITAGMLLVVPLAGQEPAVVGASEREVVEKFFALLPTPERLDDLEQWIDAAGWLNAVVHRLQPAGGDAPPLYRFAAFLTPGDEPDSAKRPTEFDLGETLRRVYRHVVFAYLGDDGQGRFVFRAHRSTGNTEERWEVEVLTQPRAKGWRITEIRDAEHLRFVLLDEPAARRWWLVSPQVAELACGRSLEPPDSMALSLKAFVAMGVSDPTQAPWLYVDTLNPTEGTLTTLGIPPQTLRLGQLFSCLGGRRYRLVGVSEHVASFMNWASRCFEIDRRTQKLPLDEDEQGQSRPPAEGAHFFGPNATPGPHSNPTPSNPNGEHPEK